MKPTRPGLGSVAALAVLAGFWLLWAWPILASGERWGIWDADHYLALYEFERRALLGGVLPLWNPHVAGGTISLQHPFSSFLCPDFAWILLFGVPVGLKLQIVFRLALGLTGGYVLARSLGLSRAAALLSTLVLNGSGAYAAHVAFGHFDWTSLGFVPWALWALLGAARQGGAAWTLAGGAGVALVYLGGSIYLCVALLVFVVVFFAADAALARRPRRLVGPAAALIVAALLSAPKLLPTAFDFAAQPRTAPRVNRWLQNAAPDRLAEIPRALGQLFLRRAFDYPLDFAARPSHVARTGEDAEARARFRLFQDINYDAYVGALPLALGVLGAASVRSLPWTAGAGVLLVLVLSDPLERALGWSPWQSLRALPLLGSLAVPGRILVVAMLPLAVLVGFGLARLEGRGRRRWPRATGAGVAAIVAVVALDLGLAGRRLLVEAFPHPPEIVPPGPFVTWEQPLAGYDLVTVRAGAGAVAAHSSLGRARAARAHDDPAYRGEAFLARGPGSARLVRLDAAGALVELAVEGPGLLVLNQNHAPGWRRLDRPAPVIDYDGLVATPIDPGDREVRLGYRPPGLAAGFAASAATLAGLLLLGVRSARRRR